MPGREGLEGLSGPVHFGAAFPRELNTGSVVHFSAAVYKPREGAFRQGGQYMFRDAFEPND